ncbi:MAG: hypothetical protein FWC91_12960 [Defluviitaleaceae bacterium]|nr:hypothetical protein [Defluviitaleaceae bacterium]
MERILLVEPNYKNKYPPVGLMKLSTYYKDKGDFVEFHKGLLPKSEVVKFDKVFITTLFTFDFDMCVQTIRYYIAIVGSNNVYVGGIAATIMPENFLNAIPEINIIGGQLTSSNLLGYDDNVNIDSLMLDYDILWDISYDYAAADSYFIYTTRGCPRKCKFCAVKTLEPTFYNCNNITCQVNAVDANFGIKKQLLVMDNNILYSRQFSKTVATLEALGFGINNNKIKKNNYMKYYLISLEKRMGAEKKYGNLLSRIKKEFYSLKFIRINKNDAIILHNVIAKIDKQDDSEIITYIFENRDFIVEFFGRYNYHTIVRYIDFNQGLDARLFTDKKAENMARLAVKPCRIAFDSLKMRQAYFNAMSMAIKHGIRSFSNYLLYNHDEKPEDLWLRLSLNIQFCKDNQVSLFSFPMKFASIEHKDRSYVGTHWNKKYLRAVNIILNVTSGVVAKEEDFFIRAFGKSKEEFVVILTMPDDFIRHRDFFDEKGFSQVWKEYYERLSKREKVQLISIVENIVDEPDVLDMKYTTNIDNILMFYAISKKKVEDNELYYSNLLKDLRNNIYSSEQLEKRVNNNIFHTKTAIPLNDTKIADRNIEVPMT